MATIQRKAIRQRLHARVRRKVRGTTQRPRLAVHFTGQHIYAQIIDDLTGRTLVSVNSTEKGLSGEKIKPNVTSAEKIGKLLAERAGAQKIGSVVFDRGGFKYHGKVKALADAAREGGLTF
ncbi:MAG: 50S ribosomal protein L18 [Verrucomicrobiota bacterium]